MSPVKAEKGGERQRKERKEEQAVPKAFQPIAIWKRGRKRNLLWRKTDIGGKGRLHGDLKQVGNFHFVLPLLLAGVYLCHSRFCEFMPRS